VGRTRTDEGQQRPRPQQQQQQQHAETTTVRARKGQNDPYRSNEFFRKIASKTAHGVGHPLSFAVAMLVVIVWGGTGHLFHYSDTWQLVINTGTTIITFLMVFLIQNTQNRDSHAIHLKLDELIRANKRARDRLIALEELSEKELEELQEEFDRIARAKVRTSRALNEE
jgi:low affinity Fe/Cu permease